MIGAIQISKIEYDDRKDCDKDGIFFGVKLPNGQQDRNGDQQGDIVGER